VFDFKKNSKKLKSENKTETSSLSVQLKKTRASLFGMLFSKKTPIDDTIINELEDRFLLADVGIKTTDLIIRLLTATIKKKSDVLCFNEQIKQALLPLLKSVEQNFTIPKNISKPYLVLVVGVNGVGKTTTVGKLTKYIKSENKSVLLAAADTFRAAATEQLNIWGERNNVKVISQINGSDPGAVIYDALQSARANNIDVLIVDTAGRLHNKKNLMDEIKKINRISDKFDITIKKEILLVLDAGTGQNAVTQTKQFKESIGVDGIILTKLDGTAKGGIVFRLADELNIPIKFIGIGEKIDDLQKFKATKFIDALLKNNS
jgi:fused signal recognition particle receptor